MQSRTISDAGRKFRVSMYVCLLAANPVSAAVGVGVTPGRLGAIVAAVVGLLSVILGWRALARHGGAVAALVVALIGVTLSGLHLVRSSGAIGTGSGRGGAIVALVLALIGMILGGLALARVVSRK